MQKLATLAPKKPSALHEQVYLSFSCLIKHKNLEFNLLVPNIPMHMNTLKNVTPGASPILAIPALFHSRSPVAFSLAFNQILLAHSTKANHRISKSTPSTIPTSVRYPCWNASNIILKLSYFLHFYSILTLVPDPYTKCFTHHSSYLSILICFA